MSWVADVFSQILLNLRALCFVNTGTLQSHPHFLQSLNVLPLFFLFHDGPNASFFLLERNLQNRLQTCNSRLAARANKKVFCTDAFHESQEYDKS